MLNAITRCDLRRTVARFEKAIFTLPEKNEADLKDRLRDVIGEALPYLDLDEAIAHEGEEFYVIEALTTGKAVWIGDDMDVRAIFKRTWTREDEFRTEGRDILSGILIYRSGGDPLRNRYTINLSYQVKTPLLEKVLIRDRILSVLEQADKESRLTYYWEGNDVAVTLETEVMLSRVVGFYGKYQDLIVAIEGILDQEKITVCDQDRSGTWHHLARDLPYGIDILARYIKDYEDGISLYEAKMDLRYFTGTWDALINLIGRIKDTVHPLNLEWSVANLAKTSSIVDEGKVPLKEGMTLERLTFTTPSVADTLNVLISVLKLSPESVPEGWEDSTLIETGSKTALAGLKIRISEGGQEIILDWSDHVGNNRDAIMTRIETAFDAFKWHESQTPKWITSGRFNTPESEVDLNGLHDSTEKTLEDRANRVSFSTGNISRARDVLRDVFPHEEDPTFEPVYLNPDVRIQTGYNVRFPKNTQYPGVMVSVFPLGDRTGVIIDWEDGPQDMRAVLLEGIRKLRTWAWTEENSLAFYKDGEVIGFVWKDQGDNADPADDKGAFQVDHLIDRLGQVSFSASWRQLTEILTATFPSKRLKSQDHYALEATLMNRFMAPFHDQIVLDQKNWPSTFVHLSIDRDHASPNLLYVVAVDFSGKEADEIRSAYATRLLELCVDHSLPVTLSMR